MTQPSCNVPENSGISVAEEFTNVQNWAKHNSIISTVINLSKTKEIIFIILESFLFPFLPLFLTLNK